MGLFDLWRPRPAPTPTVVERTVVREAAPPPSPARPSAVPDGLRDAAGWAWRLLLLAGFVIGLFRALAYFSAVAVPIAVAFLLAALLTPAVGQLRRWGVGPILSAAIALVGMVLLLAALLTAVGVQAASEAPELVNQTTTGLQRVMDWLASGPLHISADQVNAYIAQGRTWLQSQGSQLATWAGSVGSSVGNFLAGLVTALMASFFFAATGSSMWASTAKWLLPEHAREPITRAARKGWNSLVQYMRATVIVCLVDATGIALVAFFLGVPMPFALFALTFIASFIPIVGAVLAGVVAAVLALVTNGPGAALIMVAGVVVVNQVEGNILQPFLLGRAVSLHPLATLLGLTAGATISGVLGALLSIPVMAFLAAFVKAMRYPEQVPDEREPRERRPSRRRPGGSSRAAGSDAPGPAGPIEAPRTLEA